MSTLTISIIQTHLFWENKPENLKMIGSKINGIGRNSEIVVLPEMFSTGFSMNPEALAEDMNGPTVTWMKKIAAENKMVLTGSIIAKDGDKYYNRLVWMLPNGQFGYYDKRHLFAYGGEDKKFSSGNKRLIASVKGWKVNLLVCYDLRFPVWSRQTPLSDEPSAKNFEFDVLIYVANWPERRIHAWKTLLQARAIENQCYVIGANRTGKDGNDIIYSGDSMIIDPYGEILHHANDKEEIFTCTLEKAKLDEVRAKFPFWRDADQFHIES